VAGGRRRAVVVLVVVALLLEGANILFAARAGSRR
jgi:hypothetical protein